jgi:hypothetical protein
VALHGDARDAGQRARAGPAARSPPPPTRLVVGGPPYRPVLKYGEYNW